MKNYRSQKEISARKYERTVAQLESMGIEIPTRGETKIGITRKSHANNPKKELLAKNTKKLLVKRARIQSRKSKKSLKKGMK